jgi:hypothetical protein
MLFILFPSLAHCKKFPAWCIQKFKINVFISQPGALYKNQFPAWPTSKVQNLCFYFGQYFEIFRKKYNLASPLVETDTDPAPNPSSDQAGPKCGSGSDKMMPIKAGLDPTTLPL